MASFLTNLSGKFQQSDGVQKNGVIQDKDDGFVISDKKLLIKKSIILSDVPSNVLLTPFKSTKGSSYGAFLGFNDLEDSNWHLVPIGKLKGIRFMSIFRFKLFWSTQRVGTGATDIEKETQFLLLDVGDKRGAEACPSNPYVLILPIFEGSFRSSIEGGKDEILKACIESGSSTVRSSSFQGIIYIHAGTNPFRLVSEAVRALQPYLGTYRVREQKLIPDLVDKFGWCTWDALYLTVNPEGMKEGLKSFSDGNTPVGFLVIDDGWESVAFDDQDPCDEAKGLSYFGPQMMCRITHISENYKFKNYESNSAHSKGMAAFIHDIKKEFKQLKTVYVWHAMTGYWGGIRPGTIFNSEFVEASLSPHVTSMMRDLAVDKIHEIGVGVVPPERIQEFYHSFHSYLANAGIDGVKVDVMQVLEMLGEKYGGRVALIKAYFNAIDASVVNCFKNNAITASMQHCNDFFLLGTQQIALGRVVDDFWVTDPTGETDGNWLHGLHITSCAYNSLWMGQFVHPDWDMFQTTHPYGYFHAASRAVSGGPVYVCDHVDKHNFELLQKLIFPDGSILRCCHFALPTRDSLFLNPVYDGTSMLKIWNLNKHGGVIAAFNCQGGGWSVEERRNKSMHEFTKPVSTRISPQDVEWIEHTDFLLFYEAVDEFVVYMHNEDKVVKLGKTDSFPFTLDPFQWEIFTVLPVWTTPLGNKFSAIGLLNMLNTGGALMDVSNTVLKTSSELKEGDYDLFKVELKGRGQFGAYASTCPKSCLLNGSEVNFNFDSCDGRFVVDIPWNDGAVKIVEVHF